MCSNLNHSAVKRLLKEYREISIQPDPDFTAAPLSEDNLFEWHFTIRGPKETPYEGGIYHGRIILPPEYPFKPPDMELLTPNGRFETHKKICLTMTSYHSESWNPGWTIRNMLVAIRAFFPTKAEGIGSIEYSDDIKRRLAARSLHWHCKLCGSHNSTALSEGEDKQSDLEEELIQEDPQSTCTDPSENLHSKNQSKVTVESSNKQAIVQQDNQVRVSSSATHDISRSSLSASTNPSSMPTNQSFVPTTTIIERRHVRDQNNQRNSEEETPSIEQVTNQEEQAHQSIPSSSPPSTTRRRREPSLVRFLLQEIVRFLILIVGILLTLSIYFKFSPTE